MHTSIPITRLELGAIMRISLLHQDEDCFSVEFLPRTCRLVVAAGPKLYEITEDGDAEPITEADLAIPPEAAA